MAGAPGNVLGIRLRRPDGSKFAVRGGHEGLFLPDKPAIGDDPSLVVGEGPTDAAALLDMGFGGVVGRPSCTGGVRLLVELARLRRPREVVIVADADEPGRRGADHLGSVLRIYVPAVRVITPPARVKDARDWLRSGGDRRAVENAIQAAPARRLTVQTREVRRGR
jgi:DNA primase